MAKAKVTIGRLEHIALPRLGVGRVQAKIDTGAFSSALHYQKLRLRSTGEREELVVTFSMGRRRVTFAFKHFRRIVVKSSTGQRTERFLVTTPLMLGGHLVRTQFSLSDRRDMKFQVLLGRKFLAGRFLVDVSRKNCLG